MKMILAQKSQKEILILTFTLLLSNFMGGHIHKNYNSNGVENFSSNFSNIFANKKSDPTIGNNENEIGSKKVNFSY